jgi:hypothetical protein
MARRIQKAPLFTHDCEACTFLGTWDGFDLYVCNQGSTDHATLIARYGDAAPAYKSGLDFGLIPFNSGVASPPMRVAYLIAVDRGLLEPQPPIDEGRIVRFGEPFED